jgi:hypothetical protein
MINVDGLINDIDCAKEWLLPGRIVTQIEIDNCIQELDDIIKTIQSGGYQ